MFPNKHSYENYYNFAKVCTKQESNNLFNVGVNTSALSYSVYNCSEVIVCKSHISRALSNVCTGDTHCATDISCLKSGSVVNAVTCHSNNLTASLPSLNDSDLVFGRNSCVNGNFRKDCIKLLIGKLVNLCTNPVTASAAPAAAAPAASADDKAAAMLAAPKRVMIVPGYGMALAQAQHKVKQLADALEAKGAAVDYAIHPVAGRMPGHMNVLLAEANVDYEHMLEMDAVNPMFPETDLVVVIGANDVVNPAANVAEGTPIYGMPILEIDKAKNIIICNFDDKPGYAGVPNPLYTSDDVLMMLGDANDSLAKLLAHLR